MGSMLPTRRPMVRAARVGVSSLFSRKRGFGHAFAPREHPAQPAQVGMSSMMADKSNLAFS